MVCFGLWEPEVALFQASVGEGGSNALCVCVAISPGPSLAFQLHLFNMTECRMQRN